MSFASHRGRNASFSSVTEAFPLLRAQEQEAERASGAGFGGAGGADKQEKLWALMASYLASDVHSIQRSIANHVEYTLAGSRFNFDQFRAYVATAHRCDAFPRPAAPPPSAAPRHRAPLSIARARARVRARDDARATAVTLRARRSSPRAPLPALACPRPPSLAPASPPCSPPRSIRDRLIESWNDTNYHFEQMQVKRVSYLSLEFLMGRSMQNALLNMDLEGNYRQAMEELGYRLEDLYDEERDAALGNGGLGRLAACFLDSMATLDLPAWAGITTAIVERRAMR
jgi:hypothetical protein